MNALEARPMYTTQLDNGTLNAYALEPQVYIASSPSPEQQRRYVLQGGLAMLLVTGLMMVALAVS